MFDTNLIMCSLNETSNTFLYIEIETTIIILERVSACKQSFSKIKSFWMIDKIRHDA